MAEPAEAPQEQSKPDNAAEEIEPTALHFLAALTLCGCGASAECNGEFMRIDTGPFIRMKERSAVPTIQELTP